MLPVEGSFFIIPIMVQSKEAVQDFLLCRIPDGEIGSISCFPKPMSQEDIAPPECFGDFNIHRSVKLPQLRNVLRMFLTIVNPVVDRCQTFISGKHYLAAILVEFSAYGRQGVACCWKREGLESIRRAVLDVVSKR